jgi:hypothetical protein
VTRKRWASPVTSGVIDDFLFDGLPEGDMALISGAKDAVQ